MNRTKSPLASLTIWGALGVFFSALAGIFANINMAASPDSAGVDFAQLTPHVTALFGAVVAILGRIRASTKIGSAAQGSRLPAYGLFAMPILFLLFSLSGCQGQESSQVGQDRWQHVAVFVGPTTPQVAMRGLVDGDDVATDPIVETGNGERFTYHGNVSITVYGDGTGSGSADRGDANQDNRPTTEAELEVAGNAVTTGEGASIGSTNGGPGSTPDVPAPPIE